LRTTSTSPAETTGVVTETVVDVIDPKVAATPPKVTDVVDDIFVPVSVTEVPPVVGPVATDSAEIVGAGGV
jgi:hypothetical protein